MLKALCDGMDVHEIATAKRVSECTVRTQLRALRDKTQAREEPAAAGPARRGAAAGGADGPFCHRTGRAAHLDKC